MKNTLLIFLLVFSQYGLAASIWCKGTVSNIYIDTAKNVIIKGSWRNEYTRICKTDGALGVDTVTCSLWVSMVMTALTNNKSVRLMYNDQGGTMTCANIPIYSNAPVPAYVMLESQ